MDDDVHIVVTDVVVKKPSMGIEFIEYGHSEDIPNGPFFVRGDAVKSIEFQDSHEMFHKAMETLVRNGKKVYHIAKPLLTSESV